MRRRASQEGEYHGAILSNNALWRSNRPPCQQFGPRQPFLRMLWRVLNTIRQIASVWSASRFAAGSACYPNKAFWVSRQSRFSNDQVENATRCVLTAAELTRYGIKGYCGRGVAICEPVYIRRNIFFLPVCRLLAFAKCGPAVKRPLVGVDRKM